MGALQDYIRTHPCQGFKPKPLYWADIDTLYQFWEDVGHYHENHPTDRAVDLMLARDNHRVIGVKVWGLSRFKGVATPTMCHNEDGDTLEIHWIDDMYFGEVLKDNLDVTLLRSRESKEVIGVHIAWISQLGIPWKTPVE